jgi:hypothetical protein
MKNLNLLILFIFISCSSNVPVTFDNSKPYVTQFYDPTSIKLKADKSDTSIIFFTASFFNEKIEVKSGEKLIDKDTISTINQIGLAKHIVVNNSKIINVKIGNKHVMVLPEKMKIYKFIYISKRGKKYFMEYSNKMKSFA